MLIFTESDSFYYTKYSLPNEAKVLHLNIRSMSKNFEANRNILESCYYLSFRNMVSPLLNFKLKF